MELLAVDGEEKLEKFLEAKGGCQSNEYKFTNRP